MQFLLDERNDGEIMAFDEALQFRIRQKLARRKNIEEKKMFGGVGFLLNGNMCVGIWKDSLVARVGPENYDAALQQPFVKEFDITGRAMTGWVLVVPEGIDHDEDLSKWIQQALKFVRTLPHK